jgi:hypothetical protein
MSSGRGLIVPAKKALCRAYGADCFASGEIEYDGAEKDEVGGPLGMAVVFNFSRAAGTVRLPDKTI